MQLFFFPSTRNRLYMPRARNCLRSRQRAGLDTASMMLKPACNGKPRRKSSTMLQEWPPAPPPYNGLPDDCRPGKASRSSASSSENATYTVARARSLCVRLSRWRWQRSSGASRIVFPDENERRDAERPKKVPVRPVNLTISQNNLCEPNVFSYMARRGRPTVIKV